MKTYLALGFIGLTGALVASACTASDSESDPDPTTTSSGGSGGSSGGSGGSGGSSGGTTGTSTASGGYGGTSDGGSAGMGWSGEAGMAGETGSGGTTTGSGGTTTGSGGNGGTGGGPTTCLGDDPWANLPDCDDLSYSGTVCNAVTPPKPYGMVMCEHYEMHGTEEAFRDMFQCLDAIDVADDCEIGGEHDDAVDACRVAVAEQTCENADVLARCENFGCPDDAQTGVPTTTCDTFLSSFSESGQDAVVACVNELTEDEPGGSWGDPPNPSNDTDCARAFDVCTSGLEVASDN